MKFRFPLLLLLVLLAFLRSALAIIVIDSDESASLATPPNGAPWNYVGRLDDHFGARASCVYLGNRYFLTADHVDHDMNNVFLNGTNYAVDTTFTPVTFTNTDLRVMRMVEDPGLPALPLIGPADSAFNKPAVMMGCGVGKGTPVPKQGWMWNDDSTRLERWATSTTLGAYRTNPVSGFTYLQTTFDRTAGLSTGQLTGGDSGGGLFEKLGGVWKLVGINSDVDTDNEALYDEDLSTPGNQPDHSYFQSVAQYASQLEALIAPNPVTTLAASGVLLNGATVNGSVDPNGVVTTVHFEYGLTAAYGASSSAVKIGAGSNAAAVQARLTSLRANTTYHYRVVAASSEGTHRGRDVTFATLKPQPTDFDANGTPDLVLLNSATGATAVQTYHKNKLLNTASGPTLPAGYQLAGVADFNNDGQPDYLLVQSSTGALSVWLLNGMIYSSAILIRNAAGAAVALPAGWQVAAVADLNADGQPDLVLFNPATRNINIWYLSPTTSSTQVTFKKSAFVTRAGAHLVVPGGWQVAGVGDFNADNQADLLLFNPSTLQTSVCYLDTADVSSQAAGPTLPHGWQLAGLADYNSDGQPDLLLLNTKSRTSTVWYLQGLTHVGGANLVDASNVRTVLPAGFSIAAP